MAEQEKKKGFEGGMGEEKREIGKKGGELGGGQRPENVPKRIEGTEKTEETETTE